MPNETKTPRTDAFQIKPTSSTKGTDQLRDFARQLETELNEANNSTVEWMARCEKKNNETDSLQSQLSQREVQLKGALEELAQTKTWANSEIALLKSLNAEAIREHERMALDNAKLRPLAQELSEAWNEAACCDDIPLDRPLARFIGNLCRERDQLRQDKLMLDWLEKWMSDKYGNEIYGPKMPIRLNRDCGPWTLKEGSGSLSYPISTAYDLRAAVLSAMKGAQ